MQIVGLNKSVTWKSMLAVFALSIIATLFIGHGLTDLSAWLYTRWGISKTGTFFAFAILRCLPILLIATWPFLGHLDEKPSLIFLLISVSFCATLLPWWLLGYLGKGIILYTFISHSTAILVWWTALYEGDSQ